MTIWIPGLGVADVGVGPIDGVLVNTIGDWVDVVGGVCVVEEVGVGWIGRGSGIHIFINTEHVYQS